VDLVAPNGQHVCNFFKGISDITIVHSLNYTVSNILQRTSTHAKIGLAYNACALGMRIPLNFLLCQ
jgi:hypothetical protein